MGALGFSVLRFWPFFGAVFRFCCPLRFAVFPLCSNRFLVFGKKYYRFFGFDRFLKPGKHKFSGFDVFMRFSDLIKIYCGFSVLGKFLCGFAVFNVPQRPPPWSLVVEIMFWIMKISKPKILKYCTFSLSLTALVKIRKTNCDFIFTDFRHIIQWFQ